MTAPVDYGLRAGQNPPPPGWSAPRILQMHTRDAWESFLGEHPELAAVTLQFFADVSEFQRPVDSSYPYGVLAIRLDTGWRLDDHLDANWGYVRKNPSHIKVAPGYVVFVPGESKAILNRLKHKFGSQCPPPLCPMTDMESGAGFAGRGNHSAEANDFQDELAAWSGNRARLLGYANAYDWSGNWPSRPSWLKRTLADYSANPTPAGYYARQYYGGLHYPVPRGYPTACAPFGAWVDMNVVPRSLTQIQADFGLSQEVEVLTKQDLQVLVGTDNVIPAPTDSASYDTNKYWAWVSHIGVTTLTVRANARALTAVAKSLASVLANQAEIKAQLSAIQKQLGGAK